MIIKKVNGITVTEHKKIVRNRMRLYELYGAREGLSSVHLVLSWPRHTNSWKRDMWWAQDINLLERHINSRELDILWREQDINLWERHINSRELDIMWWAQDINLWERHINSRELDILWRAQDINLWERHINSRELDIMWRAQDMNLLERHINSRELDIMSWSHDCFVEVTTSFQDDMLKEGHIFLVAMSLMCKQTYTTIATRDYQRFIHILF